jgi:hypothetical protein
MKSSWTAGLTPEQKERLVSDFLVSAGMRERLAELLKDKITSLHRDNLSRNKYESPSWALVQADGTGYERAMNEIISLISNEKVEK